jgi:cyclase
MCILVAFQQVSLNKTTSRSAVQTLALLALLLASSSLASAQNPSFTTTEIKPDVLVFSTSSGNVIASVGADGFLVIGPPAAADTDAIREVLMKRTNSPHCYVIIWPQPLDRSQGDAGWTKHGCFVAMQENALGRLGGGRMGKPTPLPPQFATLGVARPPVGFSEVIKFDMNADAIHIIHQKPGYSDADLLAHFEQANLVYFGEDLPGDGYPAIDKDQHGSIDGFLSALENWNDDSTYFGPARGDMMNGTAVQAFRQMIVTVRDRVKKMVDAGKTEAEVVASHPTADFDSRWGHGRVKPDDFVHEVFASLKPTDTKK